MNRILYLICVSILISCNLKNEIKETKNIIKTDTLKQEITQEVVSQKETENLEVNNSSNRISSLKNDFKKFEIKNINDTIKADLNGDKIFDFAFLSNNNNKREMFVLDGKTNKKIKIGQDKSFEKMSDDFNWVDFWGITDDKETFEILIDDSEIVGDTITKLINKSIFVRKDEVGGGVITCKNNNFIWIHQSD